MWPYVCTEGCGHRFELKEQLPILIEIFQCLNFKRAKNKGPCHNTFVNYHKAHLRGLLHEFKKLYQDIIYKDFQDSFIIISITL